MARTRWVNTANGAIATCAVHVDSSAARRSSGAKPSASAPECQVDQAKGTTTAIASTSRQRTNRSFSQLTTKAQSNASVWMKM